MYNERYLKENNQYIANYDIVLESIFVFMVYDNNFYGTMVWTIATIAMISVVLHMKIASW